MESTTDKEQLFKSLFIEIKAIIEGSADMNNKLENIPASIGQLKSLKAVVDMVIKHVQPFKKSFLSGLEYSKYTKPFF